MATRRRPQGRRDSIHGNRKRKARKGFLSNIHIPTNLADTLTNPEIRKLRIKERTARIQARTGVRKERVTQKGKSGFWSPEAVASRSESAARIGEASAEAAASIGQSVASVYGGGAVSELADAFGGASVDEGGGSTDSEASEGLSPVAIGAIVLGGGAVLYFMSKKKG